MNIELSMDNIYKGDIQMSDNVQLNTKITPVGLGASAIVGGAAGVLAHQGYIAAKKAIKEAKPDSYLSANVKAARNVKEAVKNFFKNNKFGKFLKHPATIGVAAGAAIYIAAKKLFAPKPYID